MLPLLHPLVDFCSVAVLASGGITLERWLAYNALAFALQLPLGVALDVLGGGRSGIGRAGFAVGCALAAGGGLAAAFGFSGWLPLVAACVGNALFHLTAGANVLERSPGRSGPVGLFISTGAIGLMAGQMVATGGYAADVLGAWRGYCPFGRSGGKAAWTRRPRRVGIRTSASMLTRRGRRVHAARVLVTGVSVAGSAVLCFACSPSHAALWLVLLFVAQLATGPVLSLMYDLSGRRAGSSFGLNCLGLFTGSLV